MAQTDSIVLGGGCFWCVEAVMLPLRGVTRVVSGYANGHVQNPTYREVCSGRTGHNEVVRVEYDPEAISTDDLLGIFMTTHDPTTLNRQGADRGTQYRSVVLPETEAQRETAEAVIAELDAAGVFDAPIVTTIEPFTTFYEAEPHHQDYYRQNSGQPYCAAVIAPKVAKLRAHYLDKLRPEFA